MGIALAYVPHRTQGIIHHDRRYRFRAVCCGRRWGKTRFAAAELLDIAGERGGLYAWVAPTYYIAERGQKALALIGGSFVQFRGQNPVRAHFTGEGGPVEILFLSADNPDTILGDGFDGVIVDEAARLEKAVWDQNIRPALADKQGWAVLISTPRARNWFFDFHTRGRDPKETLYRSYSFTSLDNPHFPPEEWEEAKRTTPSDIFHQEYEAQFLEDSAGVFRNIEDLITPAYTAPLHEVVLGVDLAKHNDFTVLLPMDRGTGAVVGFERFNKLEWPLTKERIVQTARKYDALVALDSTGIGDVIYDDLKRELSAIAPYRFTSRSKTELIQRLIVATEQRRISWPAELSELTNEMKRFEYAVTPKGEISYDAPSGYHDDTVIALALANLHRWPTNSGPIVASTLPRRAAPAAIPRRRRFIFTTHAPGPRR